MCLKERMLSDRLLDAREIGWNFIVAVKLEVVKGGGDTEPARHVGGLHAAHFCDSDGDDVAATQGTANEDDFQFNGGIEFDAFGAKKKDSGRADVARDKGHGIFFDRIFHAAQPRRRRKNSLDLAQIPKEKNG